MRALISVSDKNGILDFAKELAALGFEIISTGGTYTLLQEAGVKVTPVSNVTGFPECLDGRVKTLHPNVHAGILSIRSNPHHMEQLDQLQIQPIDLVAVNLYPFKQTILKPGCTLEEAVENIDIGGPTMLRSAAKNYNDVTVLVDPSDYAVVLDELKTKQKVSAETNFYLAGKVFQHTAHYDAMIASYLSGKDAFPQTLTLTYEKVQDMRYGENPHQAAAFYQEVMAGKGCLPHLKKLHGKELSFNNINDTHGALELLKEFEEPTVVACKHSNPCGVGSGSTLYEAYMKAYSCDPVSVFGGIIVANREVDEAVAAEISKIFIEIVLAPSFSEKALEILKKKKNIRLLTLDHISEKQDKESLDIKKVSGGILVQKIDSELFSKEGLRIVTKRQPTEKELEDLRFAWTVVKYVKSNGIALSKDKAMIGAGPGQVQRFWACKQAIEHAHEHMGVDSTKSAVLASDAFFPFTDCVEAAHQAGITAIIQPGGSVKDQDSIDACDKFGIAMIFTDMRHFRH